VAKIPAPRILSIWDAFDILLQHFPAEAEDASGRTQAERAWSQFLTDGGEALIAEPACPRDEFGFRKCRAGSFCRNGIIPCGLEGQIRHVDARRFRAYFKIPDDAAAARRAAAAVSAAELRAWYKSHVADLSARGHRSSLAKDFDAARAHFGVGRVTRKRVKAMRDELAPPHWKIQGRPPPSAIAP
jgi:hypothetical protein